MAEKAKVTCIHCGYSWGTKSELEMLSCPSCSLKFNREGKVKYKNKWRRAKFPAFDAPIPENPQSPVVEAVKLGGYNIEVR